MLATGSIGKSWKFTSNSWESTGDGHAMAIWAGADVIDMECVQFHPTGMVWPLSVRGILVTEGVRGDGGVLRNSEGKRFMFDYVADMFRAETADTEEEADRWYDDHINNRRTPDLLPRDEVARAINSEVKAGRGTPARRRLPRHRLAAHAPSTSAAACPRCTTSSWSWPASTSPPTPMEVGPTCHYMMGGVRVDAETQAATVPGPLRRRRGGRAACTAPTASAATRSRTCSSSAAGPASARPTTRRAAPARRSVDAAEVAAVIDDALAPFGREGGDNPYDVQHELQETMQALVGIIRTGPELEEALAKLEELKQQTAKVQVKGGRAYNPGWNLATDLPSMITTSIAVAQGALEPQGVAGRAHPRGLPGPRPRDGQGQLRPAPDRRARLPGADRHRARAAARDAGRAARTLRGGTLSHG